MTILALTVGDPAGIGPEIVVRTLAESDGADTHGVAVGDAAALRRAAQVCGLDMEVRAIGSFDQARHAEGIVDCLDLGITDESLPWGRVDATAGRAAVEAIEVATRAALAEEVAGIVTAPINKEAIWAAGSEHLGHTEMLGALTGSTRFNTMFVVRNLRIFFATRHMSLRGAIDDITRERLTTAIAESWTALRVLGIDEPRLAVAALNPHGGEGGHFGREELDEIGPACDAARAGGRAVIGPIPSDAVFHQGFQGRYDGVLSMFHDQGHIAAKTVDFEGTIAVTMGLPILRTSVDHGTAFDIAGKGIASHRGMRVAFDAAAEYAPAVPRMRREYG